VCLQEKQQIPTLVFGLNRSGLEPMIYRTWGERTDLGCDWDIFILQYVSAFAVSAISSNWERIGKPFNPLLGETYEFDRWVRNKYDMYLLISQSHDWAIQNNTCVYGFPTDPIFLAPILILFLQIKKTINCFLEFRYFLGIRA
jgi:hypothetical protein